MGKANFKQVATNSTMYFEIFFCLMASLLSAAVVIKSSDGTDIFATAAGKPQNPSLIFSHGFALSGVVFDNLFQDKRLLDHFYLVCADEFPYTEFLKPILLGGL
jgi:hypothetical protein